MKADTRQRSQDPPQAPFAWTRLTPTGPAALASFGLRGPSVVVFLERCFVPAGRRPASSLRPGDVAFGRLQLADDLWEEVVLAQTAREEWELHTHGGSAVVQAVARRLQAAGAQELTSEQWSQAVAFDPITAAAWVALAQARTDRAAQILLDQYRGALAAELRRLVQLCHEGRWAEAAEGVAVLQKRWALGRHLTCPWRVVLAGRPNAGKSSLLNALAGYERAIVFPEPGTTRDLLFCSLAVEGWPVELVDMAGLRWARDAMEAAGVERARRALAEADLILLVVDGTVGWDSALWEEIAPHLPPEGSREHPSSIVGQKSCLVVYNKADLPARWVPGAPAGVAVSARTGLGLDRLLSSIARQLVPAPPVPGAAMPFTTQQAAALEEAAELFSTGRAHEAARRLERLLGS